MNDELFNLTEFSHLKCDHCGEIIERGIISVSNHSFDCKAAETVKINDTFSAIYTPFSSYTPTNELP